MQKKILIVAAHPDDEILGCGGTVARLVKEGFSAYCLILGEGVTSRDKQRDPKRRQKMLNNLKKHAHKANRIIGVKKLFMYDLPDNRFDSVQFLDIVKIIESIKNSIKPHIIFTHHSKDLNIDHQITYKAVITATRPLVKETVKEIYSFEVISSSEWNFPEVFSPAVFFNISDTIGLKLKALKEYKSEIKTWPHPRSLRGVKICAELWGMKSGLGFAEAFKCVRYMK